MKLITALLFTIFFLSNQLNAQRIPNQSSPSSTLDEVFRAARTGNLASLHLLCHPDIENDGDTKQLCAMNEQIEEEKYKFIRFFKQAYCVEETIISATSASVRFKFGPKAQINETMQLLKQNNKWYLYSF